ncbi:hypothetical protein ACT4UT_04860 [Bacillus sp. B-TM1]
MTSQLVMQIDQLLLFASALLPIAHLVLNAHQLVNNVAQQYPQQGLEYITAEQLEKTFRINIL